MKLVKRDSTGRVQNTLWISVVGNEIWVAQPGKRPQVVIMAGASAAQEEFEYRMNEYLENGYEMEVVQVVRGAGGASRTGRRRIILDD